MGSIFAAEALSLQEVLSDAIYLWAIINKSVGAKEILKVPYINSNTAVNSTKEHAKVRWVQASDMLADCLTKRCVHGEGLLNMVKRGMH